MAPVLEVENLATHFALREGLVKAVDGVSFSIAPGEVLGLVGESGSGKSVTGFSIMGLVDPPGRVVEGSIRLEGRELVGLSESEMRGLRGRRPGVADHRAQGARAEVADPHRRLDRLTEPVCVFAR